MNTVISMFTNNILGTRIISKCMGLPARVIHCTVKQRREMMRLALSDFVKAHNLALSETQHVVYKPRVRRAKLLRNRHSVQPKRTVH